LELLALIAAAVLAFRLARKLCGDPYAACLAAVLYVFSPVIRLLTAESPRLAAGTALLPLLCILFYWTNELPRDEPGHERKIRIGVLALCLAALGFIDPRFALTAGLLIWLALLLGYLMDRRRRSEVWAAPFSAWALATAAAIALYAPLWWWRRLHPGGPAGGALSGFPLAGADFMELWYPSPFYIGMTAYVMAIAALLLTRSYRQQARLWFILCGFMLWLAIGPEFRIAGRYLWWVPALYRGAGRIPPLAGVDPCFYAAAAQLSLSVLSAFGFGALLSHVDPLKLRWVRPIATALIGMLIIGDFLRVRPFLP